MEEDELGLSSVQLVPKLLDWYDGHARSMPWRSPPGGPRADPYHVWLSEVMLQQTTVATVGPYFTRFLSRWPDVGALAAAPLDDVLHAWAGLGYYARARNLHKCARVVSAEFGGRFPQTEAALRALPGVGPYTAAAIASIAFNQPETVVDGNVERVMARLHAVETPLPDAKPELKRLAAALTPQARPGDYAQAVMDLGATICTPRSPDCGSCPWAVYCVARKRGIAAQLPARRAKPERPVRRGHAFWLEAAGSNSGGALVLIRRRPETGLLGGMIEFPTSDWTPSTDWAAIPSPSPPVDAAWHVLDGLVEHSFTHFHLELVVHRARIIAPVEEADGFWHPVAALDEVALPTVMKKIAVHVGRRQP